MNVLASQLAAMQQADNFFPGGAVAWSWGLETLLADGRMGEAERPRVAQIRQRGIDERRSAKLLGFIEGQLRHRWSCFDRAILQAAWQSDGDLKTLMALDARVEALTLATEQRAGSRRLGLSFLGVHAGIGTAGAERYRAEVQAGRATGHLPVVQGLLWHALGMSLRDCQVAAVHGFCTGLVSAALRLGMLGHLEAQQVLTRLQPVLLELLASAPPESDQVHGFSPLAEIAVMRHESQELRLFAN